MKEPDSLHELPMLKHHTTPGDVPRDDTAAYLDLGAVIPEDEQPDEATQAEVAEVYADD